MIDTLTKTKPKLGFAGVGWIGKNRLEAIRDRHIAEMTAIADPDTSALEKLKGEYSELKKYNSFRSLLESDLDGIVIATPSALHAEQALAALNSGKAVFCQKPLGRNKQETRNVVETAREKDLLLEVDFSYRYTLAMRKLKQAVRSGRLGEIYGINLTYHNAYGPGKSWYRDPTLAGGGCLMDLGIHLVDLLYWILDEPEITDLQCRLFSRGKPFKQDREEVEDYAAAQITLNGGTVVQLSCSWNLPSDKDAVIEASFYGEHGGVTFRNTDGSFYDFVTEEYNGTSTIILAEPPDDWCGRAAVEWTEKLAEENKFNPAAETYVDVAQTLDLLYQNCKS